MPDSLTNYLIAIRPNLKKTRFSYLGQDPIQIESIEKTELSTFEKALYSDFIYAIHSDLSDIIHQTNLLPDTPASHRLIARQIRALFKAKGRPAIYFALPNEKSILELCHIAKLTAETLSDDKETIHPIQILLPHVTRFDPAPVSYISGEPPVHLLDTLSEKTELTYLLKSHVLGETGEYLIPINHITCVDFLEKHKWNEMKITNPYPDYEAQDTETHTHYFLSESDVSALKHFHPDTTALFDAYHELCSVKIEDNDLLTQLHILCDLLSFNDAHEGIGEMLNAGQGAYAAITHFFSYWDQLPEKSIHDIHAPLLAEIQKLRLVSTDHTVNTPESIESTIDSCIGNFKANFRLHTQNITVQRKLASIKPANELTTSQNANLLNNIHIMAKQLTYNLQPDKIHHYNGRAKNMLCRQGAEQFVISTMIHNSFELSRLITHIHENDLRLMLTNQANAQSLVILLGSLEDLQLISLNISNLKRVILFEGLQNYFFQRFGRINFKNYLQMTTKFILLYDPKLMPSLVKLFYPKSHTHSLAVLTTLQTIMMCCEFSLTHRPMFDQAFSIASQIKPDEFKGRWHNSVSGQSLLQLLLYCIHLLRNQQTKSNPLTPLLQHYFKYLNDINHYEVCSADLWRAITSNMKTLIKMVSERNNVMYKFSFLGGYLRNITVQLLNQIDTSEDDPQVLNPKDKIMLCGQVLSFANAFDHLSKITDLESPLDCFGKGCALSIVRFYLKSDSSLKFETHNQKLPPEILNALQSIMDIHTIGNVNFTMHMQLHHSLVHILKCYTVNNVNFEHEIQALTFYLRSLLSTEHQASLLEGIDLHLRAFAELTAHHIAAPTTEHPMMHQLIDSLEANGVLALMPNEFANQIITQYRTESTASPSDIPSPHKKMKLT